MNMEDLERTHDLVKKHKFRLNKDGRSLKSYARLVRRFLDEAYSVMCDDKSGIDTPDFFFHDFAVSIYHLSYEKNKDAAMMTIELCIMDIHKYMMTGKFEIAHLYYFGSNIGPGEDRITTYKKIKGKWEKIKNQKGTFGFV